MISDPSLGLVGEQESDPNVDQASGLRNSHLPGESVWIQVFVVKSRITKNGGNVGCIKENTYIPNVLRFYVKMYQNLLDVMDV